MGGSCRGWLPLQVPELSERHRTVIYDHRGVGESADPGGPFTIADLADDAAALLDALGIARAHVLGAFMGGMVAQELALRHPSRVDRLVLVGTYARPDAKRRMLLAKWKAMAGHGLPLEVIAQERMLWTLSDETLEQTDLVSPMLQGFVRHGFPMPESVFARQCDACLGHDALPRLDALDKPTLVVCGQQDVLTPPKLHRELASAISGAQLVTIPNAAHLVMAEAAKRLNQIVLQFLADEH
jgi:pimeloyl-ACP methyl ester carboxylesterase